MKNKIKLACVNYLNTLPLLHGLRNSGMANLEIHQLKPKDCYRAFIDNEVDVSLVPTGALDLLDNYILFGNTCIGSIDAVHSVAVFSNQDIEDLDTIYLDDHSTTSVALLKILLRYSIQKDIQLEVVDAKTKNQLEEGEGILLIGDKAISGHSRFECIYDLGEAWKAYSGLPFVYACWVADKSVAPEILEKLDQAMILGTNQMDQVIGNLNEYPENLDLNKYLNSHISFTFNAEKRKGLERFLFLKSTFELASESV